MNLRNDGSDTCNLEKFKSDLITRRLALKRCIIEQKKFDLQDQQVVGSSAKCDPDEQPPLLQAIPEEIWLKILELLDSYDDLRNCYNTCRMFREWLLKTKKFTILQNLRKALPILVKENYLDISDIIKFRLVSKSFCNLVDHMFESRELWRNGKFPGLPLQNQRPLIIQRWKDVTHPRNPFIGRSVRVKISHRHVRPFMSPTFVMPADDLEYMHVVEETSDYEPSLSILENNNGCGKYVWYLEVKENSLLISDFSKILRTFPNLRKLNFWRLEKLGFSSDTVSSTIEDMQRQLPNAPYLVSIVLPTHHPRDGTQTIGYDTLMNLQHTLVAKFSGQLQELMLSSWDMSYSTYTWPKLKTLELEKCDSVVTLRSLRNMKAPNLKKLTLKLFGHHDDCLEILLQVINSFSQLESLILEFDRPFEISDTKIPLLPVTSPDIGSVSLKRIQVKTNAIFDNITYSFLIYFPYLEFIQLDYQRFYRVEDYIKDRDVAEADTSWMTPEFIEQMVISNYDMHKRMQSKRDKEVLEIREYLYINRADFSNSNVWQILPFLQAIHIVENWKLCGQLNLKMQTIQRRYL